MSRQDLGAANGGVAVEPGRCTCRHLIALHKPATTGRGACSASTCNCRKYQEVRRG